MDTILTTQIDAVSRLWIEREAERTGSSVEALVRQLIYRSIDAERQRMRQERYHELDGLAGTWGDKESEEFFQATEEFNAIDRTLWP